jgi:hypothetical protein
MEPQPQPRWFRHLARLFIWPCLLFVQVAMATPTEDTVPVPQRLAVSPSINISSQQSTTLEFGYWGAKGSFAPHEPVPATFVPSHSKLILKLSDHLGAVSDLKWFRNNEQIATEVTELEIATPTASDSGFYWATFNGNPETPSTSSLQIIVASADRHRLGNMSVRSTLTSATPSSTVGFVVQQQGAYPSAHGEYLIRVIGPSLAQFQVSNPLPDPIVRFFNATGNEIIFAHTMIFRAGYFDWLKTVSSSVGAFPVDLPSPPETVEFVSLPVGAYTAQVTSASGAEGDFLFEIYEILDAPPFP